MTIAQPLLTPSTVPALAGRYLHAVLAADRVAARDATSQARSSGLQALEIYEQIYRPALYDVGKKWERGDISVTSEHIATALTEGEMTALLPEILNRVRHGRTAVVASVEGEAHRVGARMVADCFESEGWDAVYVGGDTPLTDLVAWVAKQQPEVIALSLTVMKNRSHLDRAIERLTAAFPDRYIFVGGQALHHLPKAALPQGPKIRVIRDLRTLKALIRSLTSAPFEELPDVDTEPMPWTRSSDLSKLEAQVRRLPLIHTATVDALEASSDALQIFVNGHLQARHDILALVGSDGLDQMRNNHAHHAQFIISWLRYPDPAVLVSTVAWVVSAYRSHGFQTAYWPIELEAWQAGFANVLQPADSTALRPLYRWMIKTVLTLAEQMDADVL